MGLRRPPVVIELDGKERILKYDLNALCLFEEHSKTTLARALNDRSMSSIRALLWAGLLHEDSLLTIEDVGKMSFSNLREVSTKLAQALNGDSPEADADRPTAAPGLITTASTGGISGPSGDSISVLATANSGD
jgi:hypothetical protein